MKISSRWIIWRGSRDQPFDRLTALSKVEGGFGGSSEMLRN